MKKSRMTKNKAATILASACVLCLGGALAGLGAFRSEVLPSARAEEDEYFAFVNVGGNDLASEADAAVGLAPKGATVVTAGAVTEGNTLFGSYAENASYSLTLPAGSYRVAVAVIAENGTSVKAGGNAVALPEGASGNTVASAVVSVTGDSLTVEVTGKLCGILVTAEDAKVLMTADYTAGQAVPYGALLADVLENATGYYSDGTTEELKIEYSDIVASGGVNVNFTTVNVTGKVEGTELSITRYVVTMPEELVYFINTGSTTDPGKYPDVGADPCYAYNQTVFDFYENKLKNDGVPDKKTSKGSDEWGCYTDSVSTSPDDATFPYNSLLWNEEGTLEVGYNLTGLDANARYRIYIGTLSHWHARTVRISFNGETVGADNLRINSSKGFSVYENVPADANGKIDLNLKGEKTNEPCINFIAVQKAETEIPAIPAKPEGGVTVGMEDTSIVLTGVTEGSKLQLFNASRPNQVLYEEAVDPEKIQDGSYTLEWGKKLEGISQFNVVAITAGGVSEPLLVSVTDIEIGDSLAVVTAKGYTTGSAGILVQASADSGIVKWSYKLGEYGEVHEFDVEKVHDLKEEFTVTENGDYYVVVTSGLGVTYSEIVEVRIIDTERPVIVITPSSGGWKDGAYAVSLAVESIAPVTEYCLYKNGAEISSSESAPSSVTFTQTGEYLISVKTSAGRSAVVTVTVSANPSLASVTKSYANRTLKYTFSDTDDHKVASVAVYEILDGGVSKMTISSGNVMDVYNAGTYVAMVTTQNGAVEMFSIGVSKEDLSVKNQSADGKTASNNAGAQLGIGLGIGIGGIILAGAAVAVTFVLLKKKRQD